MKFFINSIVIPLVVGSLIILLMAGLAKLIAITPTIVIVNVISLVLIYALGLFVIKVIERELW